MKILLTYTLLSIFLLNLFETDLLILHFEINRDYFAELCINKDKKNLHCNGHCQLEKQFRKHQEDQPPKEKTVPQKENSPFICSVLPIQDHAISPNCATLPSYCKILKHRLNYFEIFHPPKIYLAFPGSTY